MLVKSTLTILGIALAGAFALGPSAPAAPSSGPESVLVTNTSANPIPVSQASHRHPPFFAIVDSTTVQLVSVTYPTGYSRLVIDKVAYTIHTSAQGEQILPQLVVSSVNPPTGPAQYVSMDLLPVPFSQPNSGGAPFYSQWEVTGLGTIVDSGNFLFVNDVGGNAGTSGGFVLNGHFEP